MTKKSHQKVWELFPKKPSLRNLGLRNFFPSPPNSAPGLRLWSYIIVYRIAETYSNYLLPEVVELGNLFTYSKEIHCWCKTHMIDIRVQQWKVFQLQVIRSTKI